MRDLIKSLKVIVLALFLSLGLNVVYAWVGPTATAPLGNISAPINISALSQYKIGALGVGGLFVAYSGFQVGSIATQAAACTPNGLVGSDANGNLAICKAGLWSTLVSQAPPANPCTLPWGGTIASGQSTLAYYSPNVGYGGSCAPQSRTCTNGVLSGSYTNQSCYVDGPSGCSQDGVYLSSGQSGTFYPNRASNNCGGEAQSRYCSNGYLSGTAPYASCHAPVWVYTGGSGGCTNTNSTSGSNIAQQACSPVGATNSTYTSCVSGAPMQFQYGCSTTYHCSTYTYTCQ